MALRDTSFEALSRLLLKKSGLVLTPDKGYLVQSRLRSVAELLGYRDVDVFVDYLAVAPSERAVQLTVEAMATHETSFFRDMLPFERLRRQLLPALLNSRPASAPLNILCAACSSGQEPVSLAIMLDEMGLIDGSRPITITAFDISEAILEKARSGLYTEFEVRRGLTDQRIAANFTRSGDKYQVAAKLMRKIVYRQGNLLGASLDCAVSDIVFCRNVLIYFDDPTKAQILATLARTMPADGILILGSSETLLRESVFNPEAGGRGIFVKSQRDAPLPAAKVQIR